MRHVTDGELHAFLDGALDLLPDGRGEEIRDHIAECPVCRERLQDEEGIRSEAEGILGAPDLSEVGLPTFEELRERADAPLPEPVRDEEEKVHYRGPLKGLPLAWAATIVLALGVGWMGSEVFRTLPQDGRPRAPSDFLESVQPTEARVGDQSPDSSSGTDLPMEEAARELSPEPELARAAVPSPPPVEEGRARRQDEAREVVEAPDNPKPGVVETEAVSASTVDETVVLPDSSTPLSALGLAAVQGRQDADLIRPELVLETDSLETDSLESSFAVPGLKVVSIGWEERVPGERALLIRQILSPGDTLELRYLGLLLGVETEPRREADPMPLEEVTGSRTYANVLEASLPPGWTQVVMERGRGLLIARAPTDPDHLKALLKTLR